MSVRGRINRPRHDTRELLEGTILHTLDVLKAQRRTPISQPDLALEAKRASGRDLAECSKVITALAKAKRIHRKDGLIWPKRRSPRDFSSRKRPSSP